MHRLLPLSFVFAIVLSTTVLASASPAGACQCDPFDDDTAFEVADAVFIGQVERLHEARDGGSGYEVALFEVSDVFKGDVVREQGIATYLADECGNGGFVAGEAYLVYASLDVGDGPALEDGFLLAGPCSSAKPLAEIDDVALPSAVAPADAGPPTAAQIQDQLGDPRSSLFPEALIFVGVLGFILGLAAWFSRKGRPAI
ncbi:MAG: hypothetical protein RIB98_12015 [Acidimicrobiales bacterium]